MRKLWKERHAFKLNFQKHKSSQLELLSLANDYGLILESPGGLSVLARNVHNQCSCLMTCDEKLEVSCKLFIKMQKNKEIKLEIRDEPFYYLKASVT